MLLKLKTANLAQSTSIVHRDPRQTGLTVPRDSIVLEIKLLDFKMPVLLERMDQTSVIKVSWYCSEGVWLGFALFNTTSNNISVISWKSVLLVEETRVPGEKHCPTASH